MRPTVALVVLAMLLCQSSAYPPRYAHRRGHIHRHHKHHEQSDEFPKAEQILTIPAETRNTTRTPFNKKQAIIGHPEGL